MSIETEEHRTYSFGDFTLDVDRGALLHADDEIKLRPQSFEVLRYLLEHHGRLISKDELLDSVWGHKAVTDDSITQCLIEVRRAIRDTSQKMIVTVPKRGYIFDLQVLESSDSVEASSAPAGVVLSTNRDTFWLHK